MKIKLKKLYIKGNFENIYQYTNAIKEAFSSCTYDNNTVEPKEIDIEDIDFYNDYFFYSSDFLDIVENFKDEDYIQYIQESFDVEIVYIFKKIK